MSGSHDVCGMESIAFRWKATVVCLSLVAALTALAAGLTASLSGRSEPPARAVHVVHAEQSGLRLGLEALTGRVSLVASTPGLRWRIAGATSWRQADGRVLVRGWDTTRLGDGQYRLELSDATGAMTQGLSIRNVTPIVHSPLANASAGLDTRSTDGRAVVAVFARRSYRPGEVAVLHLAHRYPVVLLEILHVGPEQKLTIGNETIEGVTVAGPFLLTGGRETIRVRIGHWESGLYAARLSAPGRLGFAPFVLRPAALGTNRVAVVQPTNTWQAYNYRDANGDGRPDTWYYDSSFTTVDMSRPFLDRGVPPHFRAYDLGFLRWLCHTGKHVDMLSQEDLERIPGDRLAQLYRLIVFPGHHEYVTEAEYNAVQRFRDLGGNLAFLSANNFFSRVNRDGDRITRIGRWRDLGRPESALVGVQYFDWNHGKPAQPFIVTAAADTSWLFAGTGLAAGANLGWFGIEVDERTVASPASAHVLATIPDAFGDHRPAEMIFYRTARGANVFAAGAFTLAGPDARTSTVSRMLENLWQRLAAENGV